MSATVDAVRFELHCHSTCSDGTEAADQVAARAAERNVDVFALTDHDTCAGSAVTVAGARVLKAVEVTCDHDGRTIHVLAYDRGGAGWADLERRLADLREARRNRMRMMAAKLAQRGIRIDVEPLIADAERTGRTLGRPDLARLMVEHKAATSLKDAFARHLYDHGPVDVPTRALSLVDALALGRAANAAMALAHPHLYDQLGVTLLKRHVGDGLRGVEAFYGVYDPRERKRWLELADDVGLVCTAGSDWHGPEEAHAQIGVDVPDDRAEPLRDWLLGG
jgi:predicted metal-dependent phosphoesterase TrpH